MEMRGKHNGGGGARNPSLDGSETTAIDAIMRSVGGGLRHHIRTSAIKAWPLSLPLYRPDSVSRIPAYNFFRQSQRSFIRGPHKHHILFASTFMLECDILLILTAPKRTGPRFCCLKRPSTINADNVTTDTNFLLRQVLPISPTRYQVDIKLGSVQRI